MEWVAIAVNIARDPAVHRIAATLKIRVPEVVGLLALTFAEMSQHAPDGQVGDVPDTLLETWAGWHGKRGIYAAQFRAALCDAAGLVTAWDKYNGASIRRANAARERTRTWRETREKASPNAPANANGTHTRTHTESVSVCRTEQDSTGPDRTVPTDEQIAEQPRVSTVEADAKTAFVAAMGEHLPAVLRFLETRPPHSRENWWAALLKIIGPATGVLPEDLAGACEDALIAEPQATSPVAIRAFASRRKVERLKASIPTPSPRTIQTVSVVGTLNDDEAVWSQALEIVSQLRRRQLSSDAFADVDHRLRYALRIVGGWQTVNETKPGSMPFVRRDFLAAYRNAPAEPAHAGVA